MTSNKSHNPIFSYEIAKSIDKNAPPSQAHTIDQKVGTDLFLMNMSIALTHTDNGDPSGAKLAHDARYVAIKYNIGKEAVDVAYETESILAEQLKNPNDTWSKRIIAQKEYNLFSMELGSAKKGKDPSYFLLNNAIDNIEDVLSAQDFSTLESSQNKVFDSTSPLNQTIGIDLYLQNMAIALSYTSDFDSTYAIAAHTARYIAIKYSLGIDAVDIAYEVETFLSEHLGSPKKLYPMDLTDAQMDYFAYACDEVGIAFKESSPSYEFLYDVPDNQETEDIFDQSEFKNIIQELFLPLSKNDRVS